MNSADAALADNNPLLTQRAGAHNNTDNDRDITRARVNAEAQSAARSRPKVRHKTRAEGRNGIIMRAVALSEPSNGWRANLSDQLELLFYSDPRYTPARPPR